MSDERTRQILDEWRAVANAASLPAEAPRPSRGVHRFGIAGAVVVVVVVFLALWARGGIAPGVPIGGSVGSGSAKTPSITAVPSPTETATPLALPNPGGTCSASQFVLGKATLSPAYGTLGTTAVFVIQLLRNAGADCVLALPKIIGLAAATGPFEAVRVPNGGHEVCRKAAPGTGLDRECKYVYPTSFMVRSGQSVRVVLGASWWNGDRDENGKPLFSPPPCVDPISDVTRAEFPFASGSIEFGWDTVLKEVCTSPTSVSMEVEKLFAK
jgi:hypothetical protein